jgi:hypothetical protein
MPTRAPANPEKLDALITVADVATAIKALPLDKATGPDQIPYEFFKCFNKHTIRKLTSVLNNTFHTGNIPIEWKRGHMWLIHKKDSMYDVKNYRQITLLNTIYKLYTKIINYRLSKFVEKNNLLHDSQSGFRKYRNCSLKVQTL